MGNGKKQQRELVKQIMHKIRKFDGMTYPLGCTVNGAYENTIEEGMIHCYENNFRFNTWTYNDLIWCDVSLLNEINRDIRNAFKHHIYSTTAPKQCFHCHTIVPADVLFRCLNYFDKENDKKFKYYFILKYRLANLNCILSNKPAKVPKFKDMCYYKSIPILNTLGDVLVAHQEVICPSCLDIAIRHFNTLNPSKKKALGVKVAY